MRKALLPFLLFPLSILCRQNKLVEIEEAFPNLNFVQPVDIQSPDDATDRIFVVSQPGIIYSFVNDKFSEIKNEFLNIQSKVHSGGEQGLLGLAFHPNFVENGYFFVDYTASNPRRTVISRFQILADNPNEADPESELILLEVNQPYSNHNGGQLMFGPNGYLYVSFGDGGSGGDPENNGQNLTTLLGSIIRIDVDNQSDGKNYSIPDDNPFAGNTSGYREEIYVYGLRNVWKFSFDSAGNLWAADVGQNSWEEINLIEKGKNYGWRIMEGFHCFNPSSNCDQSGLELPIHEYEHNNSIGGFSITGGYVYYGSDAMELADKYIYADFVSGNFWALDYDGTVQSSELIAATNYDVSTFGLDESNELYFADYSSGKIYKFEGTQTNSDEHNVPDNFKLYQNYPNPFNPSTTIEYFLPYSSVIASPTNSREKQSQQITSSHTPRNDKTRVTLIVYDILGRRVAELFNEVQLPGTYKVKFDTPYLPSGIYFYKLNAGSFSDTKKMILLK